MSKRKTESSEPTTDKRKRTFYLPTKLLEEMEAVAARYRSPLSRVIQDCFILTRGNLDRMVWIEGTTIFGPELKRESNDSSKAD